MATNVDLCNSRNFLIWLNSQSDKWHSGAGCAASRQPFARDELIFDCDDFLLRNFCLNRMKSSCKRNFFANSSLCRSEVKRIPDDKSAKENYHQKQERLMKPLFSDNLAVHMAQFNCSEGRTARSRHRRHKIFIFLSWKLSKNCLIALMFFRNRMSLSSLSHNKTLHFTWHKKWFNFSLCSLPIPPDSLDKSRLRLHDFQSAIYLVAV